MEAVEVVLGELMHDMVTGFEGHVTAQCLYIGGDVQVLLEALTKKMEPVQLWVNKSRIRPVNDHG